LPLFRLFYHCYCFSLALFSTDAASLAIKEVSFKVSLSIPFNALIGAEDIAEDAFFVAFALIEDRPL